MSSNADMVYSIIKRNKGFVTSSQITDAGIPRRVLSELADEGRIYRAARGIYALPEAWEDEMYILQYRFSKGIFSNETALYLHDMTDRTPHTYTLTFPHGYNAAGLKNQNAKAKFVTQNIYGLGIIEMPSPAGNIIRVYDVERSLCDIVKGRNTCDIGVINNAMKIYAAAKTKDIGKLIDYAERLRVKPKILTYMEVLL
ncbi:MAG: type IV toxin-antitoxin system AbiEi family antitoxin domain-containing protein [Clostridiales Family XIII bacterium]|nr:type IV toxin-antitoxin system AbiEi family antitoxin domain-containing protein [Clostridiales Family XIII bacterium]